MGPPISVVLGPAPGCRYCKEALCQFAMGSRFVAWTYPTVLIPPRGGSAGCSRPCRAPGDGPAHGREVRAARWPDGRRIHQPPSRTAPRWTRVSPSSDQFIDHNITFDATGNLGRQVDPEATRNFRPPMLDLDHLYGSGPFASPLPVRHALAQHQAAALPGRRGPRPHGRRRTGA